MFNLKMMSPEELKELIEQAEQEIKDQTTAQVEEKKAKVVIAILELLEVCRSASIYHLGSIEWECDDCGEVNEFDILSDEILEDVAKVLESK